MTELTQAHQPNHRAGHPAATESLTSGNYVGFPRVAMLSPTGRCHAFATEADGFVRAKCGGLVILKQLTDGDRVHAIVRDTGTDADGRTAGVASVSIDATPALPRKVYGRAGVHPDDVVDTFLDWHRTMRPRQTKISISVKVPSLRCQGNAGPGSLRSFHDRAMASRFDLIDTGIAGTRPCQGVGGES